jgi:hypothetical protein
MSSSPEEEMDESPLDSFITFLNYYTKDYDMGENPIIHISLGDLKSYIQSEIIDAIMARHKEESEETVRIVKNIRGCGCLCSPCRSYTLHICEEEEQPR